MKKISAAFRAFRMLCSARFRLALAGLLFCILCLFAAAPALAGAAPSSGAAAETGVEPGEQETPVPPPAPSRTFGVTPPVEPGRGISAEEVRLVVAAAPFVLLTIVVTAWWLGRHGDR